MQTYANALPVEGRTGLYVPVAVADGAQSECGRYLRVARRARQVLLVRVDLQNGGQETDSITSIN